MCSLVSLFGHVSCRRSFNFSHSAMNRVVHELISALHSYCSGRLVSLSCFALRLCGILWTFVLVGRRHVN